MAMLGSIGKSAYGYLNPRKKRRGILILKKKIQRQCYPLVVDGHIIGRGSEEYDCDEDEDRCRNRQRSARDDEPDPKDTEHRCADKFGRLKNSHGGSVAENTTLNAKAPAFAPGLSLCDFLERKLSNYFRDNSCANRFTTLADSETHLVFHGNRGDELHLEGDGVARHDHFHALLQRHFARDVGGANVELTLK